MRHAALFNFSPANAVAFWMVARRNRSAGSSGSWKWPQKRLEILVPLGGFFTAGETSKIQSWADFRILWVKRWLEVAERDFVVANRIALRARAINRKANEKANVLSQSRIRIKPVKLPSRFNSMRALDLRKEKLAFSAKFARQIPVSHFKLHAQLNA